MSRVVDYAWGRPGVTALKGAGAVAVCRYLSYDTTGKNLTRAEADQLRAGGIDIVSNWEAAGSWAEYSGGQTTGRTHAVQAAIQHLACGGPASRPIYFSTDWDVTAGQLPAVAEYYRGVASVIGPSRTGAYGGLRVIRYLFDQDVIRWGWQTYAWSGGQWDNRAQLRQVQDGVRIGGVDCDLDESMTDDFGQWATATAGGGTDMAFDDTAMRWLEDAALHGWAVRTGAAPTTHVGGSTQTANNGNPLWDLLRDVAADMADVKAAVAASQVSTSAVASDIAATKGALAALTELVSAGGGSPEVGAILSAITTLTAQLVEARADRETLEARIAAAFGAR